MSGESKLSLVAPCGLHCAGCILYKARTDSALAQKIAQHRGVELTKVPVCLGCRPLKGHVPVMGEPVCETYNCVVNMRKLDFCYQCGDFPCLKLAPCSDRSHELTHNTKIYNLLMLQKLGLDDFKLTGGKFRKQYFEGKKPRPGNDIQMP